MYNILLMGMFQGFRNGNQEFNGILPEHALVLLNGDDVFERLTRNILHHKERNAILAAIIKDCDDAGVGKPSKQFRLSFEAFQDMFQFLRGKGVLTDNLDGYFTLEARIVGFIDNGHPSLS